MTQKTEQRSRSEAGNIGEGPSTPVVVSGGGVFPSAGTSIGSDGTPPVRFTVLAQATGTTEGWLQSVAPIVGPISQLDIDNVPGPKVALHPATLEFKSRGNTLFIIEELARGNGSYDMLITVVGAQNIFNASDLNNGEWTKSWAGFACDTVSVNGQDYRLNKQFSIKMVFQGEAEWARTQAPASPDGR
jgi:hypothetical protein